ncbi:MAG: nickel-dependent hydrogenase large subunit [Firmicutes bacterium]|nr:nickel-dependent hydrogenase large subunit [Bacillota bacterium]
MAQKIISPLTRENVPIAIQVTVDKGVITDAKMMARNMRGFEYMLKGLAPSDAPYFTERICGICSTAHAVASCLALENATSHDLTKNGVLIRNILFVGDILQNHLRHFYLLAVPDYVDLPEKPPWTPRNRFPNSLPKPVNERIVKNYFRAFEVSRDAHTLTAIMGGRAPHQWSMQPGGATIQPTAERIMRAKAVVERIKAFVTQDYREDVEALAEAYPEYFEYGTRPRNYIAYGTLPNPDKPHEFLQPPQVVLEGKVEALEVKNITEDIRFSWYRGKNQVSQGPFYAKPPEPDRSKQEAYSWIKAVRYKGRACEGGPIVRAYLAGGYRRTNATWDRHLARQWEAANYVEMVLKWISQLKEDEPAYNHWETPDSARGEGLIESMRGPLGHWVEIEGGRIKNYTVITPSVWNMGPRAGPTDLGTVEEALIGTPIKDIENPVEIGRVIRAFDPCSACAVHVITPTRKLEPIRVV